MTKYAQSATQAILTVLRANSDRELHMDDIAEELAKKYQFRRNHLHTALATLTANGEVRRYFDPDEARSYWQIRVTELV